MICYNPRTPSTRLRLLSSLVFVALAVPITTTLYAQDETQLEELVVLGSRIKRNDEISSSPVQTLGDEDLRIDGSLSLGDTLQGLPSVGPSLNSNGSAGTSHGTSSINFRNLDANRSLVLVNGHRWVNGAGTRGFRDFVDLNTIPQAIVERVEVLQDGATAIYGADAIAGVLNIHTYKDFDGLRLKGSFGQSDEGDRETKNVDLLWGKNFGRSNWLLAASLVDQDAVFTQDRERTAVPLNGLSAGTAEGIFREEALADIVGSSSISRNVGVDGNVVGNWRASDSAADRTNRYFNNYVVGPLERASIYLQNRTELTDSSRISFEVLYNNRKSDQQFSAAPAVIRGSRGFTIANNPAVNPFGIEFSGSDFRVDNFFNDVGQRVNEQEVETLRVGLGFEGEFKNDWSWDAFFSWAENDATFVSNKQLDLDKLALGLRACDGSGLGDLGAIVTGCVPVNLFNPLSQNAVDYISFTARDQSKAEQVDFSANVTGSLLELPAGDLAFAAGIEYRKEQGIDVPDAVVRSAPLINSFRRTTSAPRDGTVGEYDLNEAYIELSVPVLENLNLDLATRYSDYSTFGDTTNSKAGISYRPIESLMLRGTWAEGFRAPSIVELFEGSRSTFIPLDDPCSGGGNGLVGCAGVSAGYVQPTVNVPATLGGNLDLNPETSENISLGFVITPSSSPNTSLTVDWYDIKIDNTISEYGAQNLLNLCAATGQRCEFITRDASGEILDVVDGVINLNSTTVEGLDIVLRHGLDTSRGNIDFTLSLSRLLELTEESVLEDGGLLVEDKVGTAANRESFPEWRGSFSAKWRGDRWSSNYSARFIGDTEEIVDNAPRKIGTVMYHNISTSYRFDDNFSARIGIDNLFDKQPPISLTNLNINFDQSTYSPVGRYIYLQLSYEFED